MRVRLSKDYSRIPVQVDIAINGKAVPFSMKIGEAGEAFFVFETDGDVPDDLITSPLLEPTQPISLESPPQEDIGRFGAREREGGLGQEPDFLDLDAPSTSPPRLSKSPISSVSSLDTTSLPRKTSSNSVDTVDSTAPTSVEAEEERLPKTPNPGELGDEASPRADVQDVFGSHRSEAEGMQYPCFLTRFH